MGTHYYLARMDNQTCFELGKAATWKDAFPHTAPARISGYTIDQLAGRLMAQSLHWPSETPLDGYFRELAAQILAWSDKRPVQFMSEHDMETSDYRVTGSRFES